MAAAVATTAAATTAAATVTTDTGKSASAATTAIASPSSLSTPTKDKKSEPYMKCWCESAFSTTHLGLSGPGWTQTAYSSRIQSSRVEDFALHPHTQLPIVLYWDLSSLDAHNKLEFWVRVGDIGTIYHSETNKEWIVIQAIAADRTVTYCVVRQEIKMADPKIAPITEQWTAEFLETQKRILIRCWLE
jgi:hypothetical protein